jgi:HEAT repeat protein
VRDEITHSRAGALASAADDRCMRDGVAILSVACAVAVAAWVTVAVLLLLNRAVYDEQKRTRRASAVPRRGSRAERRLLRLAESHRTEAGLWRRIAALRTLARARHPRSRPLLERALADPEKELVGAVVRVLGELGDDWAPEQLAELLRDGRYQRSQVAAQLERFVPGAGSIAVRLLDDPHPVVRFWGATLLARYPGLAASELVALTGDEDANVRAAAVEALGKDPNPASLAAARLLLTDPVWYVRVHACRAVGELGGVVAADMIARLLRDPWWWVRSAAKDALRELGTRVVPAVVPYLEGPDEFARNGAAEVLQDLGVVDELAAVDPSGELLRRIYAAGGDRFRDAAERRTAGAQREEAA